ncbi:uncharacterized protein [Polyergus mexicanus]|uniref:uncharacterized protein n=1 Tax=Polyergus mexicanus TaxID=615972 RepID=UPI0038B4F9F1
MHDKALQQFEEINEHSSIDENNNSDYEIYNNQVNNANDEENIFDDEHGEDGNNEKMRQSIYENCPFTQDESDLLNMSFIIRHGLTDLAFDDLLNLINLRGEHYFVHLLLKDQLRNLLSGLLFYKLQRGSAEQSSIFSDITSGESYRRLRRNGVIRDYDITLQWNADGVDTFKSSKVSMCPIQVAINELPYCLRKENILLSSIWCSAKKPVMDLFLKPFVDDLKDLHENGFHCLPPGLDAPVHVRVHTIVAPVDSVARCEVKSFIIVWFTNCHNPSYIGTKKDIFDKKLTSIRPSSEMARTPRSINDIKVWKASKLKNFLLYYSMPCLKNVLSKPYYKHWSLLVFATYKFLCEKITNEDYVQAERALQIFVERIPLLYGAECRKNNVHLLLYIPKSIKYFGALWAWSAFPYESYNYVLRKMLHSSQFVLKQICKSYLRLQNIKYNDTFNKRNITYRTFTN